jgi:hypothetical protein
VIANGDRLKKVNKIDIMRKIEVIYCAYTGLAATKYISEKEITAQKSSPDRHHLSFRVNPFPKSAQDNP